MLYIIMGEFEGSGCWWLMLASLRTQHWTHVHAILADLQQDSPLTLRHGFWPQTHVNVQVSEASLLGQERFMRGLMLTTIMSGYLVTVPHSFHIVVNYHEKYMFILLPGYETYAKSVWMAKALSKPNFATFSPHFRRIP